MRQGQDDKQAVDGFCGTNYKGFEAQIHFLLLEHDLKNLYSQDGGSVVK